MSESIYERYKAALRRGHLAVLRGQLDLALEAYREAAAIVPERALPHTSIGAVELRRGRPAEALEAFEAALERSPNDEAALSGRADALAALGQRAAAAETLDRLAGLLEADGRFAEACEAVARALDLAESRSRRQHMTLLAARLRASPLDAAAEAALGRALRVLGEPALPGGGPADGGAMPAAPTAEAP
ncbi:MAG TPA: tetratricopeptide repeat protein, partial [Candidatus Binatia bacterium]|nr:tetratricopeptide repeat protein [Candidatus Binatia bacterium]